MVTEWGAWKGACLGQFAACNNNIQTQGKNNYKLVLCICRLRLLINLSLGPATINLNRLSAQPQKQTAPSNKLKCVLCAVERPLTITTKGSLSLSLSISLFKPCRLLTDNNFVKFPRAKSSKRQFCKPNCQMLCCVAS